MGQVVQDFGRLDVFVANAGMAISKAITEQTLDEYRKQMSVNGKCDIVGRRYRNCALLTAISRWSLLLCEVRRRCVQATRIRQPDHHIEHFRACSQCACGSASKRHSMGAYLMIDADGRQVYNMTKAAVLHLGKSLAREWREFARCNVVSPGFFNTKMGASPLCINEA
jgi:sorbose reductase